MVCTFLSRIVQSKLGVNNVYPVRAIANRNMIDSEFLPPDALSRNLRKGRKKLDIKRAKALDFFDIFIIIRNY